MDEREDNVRYLPSEEEIAELCAEIRAAWSPAELVRRSVAREVRPAPVQVQVFNPAELGWDLVPDRDCTWATW